MATSHLSPAPVDPTLIQSESHEAAVSAAAPAMAPPAPEDHPNGATERRPHPDAYGEDKTRILKRLRRIEGQVRGVSRMVEEDKYCIDILTQISAIVASTRSVGLLLLEDHIRGCVVNAGPDEREATLEELNRAIERFTRSVGG